MIISSTFLNLVNLQSLADFARGELIGPGLHSNMCLLWCAFKLQRKFKGHFCKRNITANLIKIGMKEGSKISENDLLRSRRGQ